MHVCMKGRVRRNASGLSGGEVMVTVEGREKRWEMAIDFISMVLIVAVDG